MLRWLTNRRGYEQIAEALYAAIVAQSRLPVFYAELSVPDTVTGRFEMIVLHMFLILERLQAQSSADDATSTTALGQALNEAFVADMDSAMREMGVADVRVSQRMHQTAGAYFGRLMAYRKALAPDDSPASAARPSAMADAIERNVLAEAPPGIDRRRCAEALAGYCHRAMQHLSAQSLQAISDGNVSFPAVGRQ